MNYLFRSILKPNRICESNGRPNFFKQIKSLSNPFPVDSTRVSSSNQNSLSLAKALARNSQNRDLSDHVRKYIKNNNGKGIGPSSVPVNKVFIDRKARRRSFRETIDDRQRRFRRDVENALEERKVYLSNTRRKIQEKGKLIMKDIKETKEKMKEKFEEVIERENVYTIPNFLCVSRIALSPLLAYLIVSQNFAYALGFMVIAGISDWIDGWIARNFKSQSSKLGSFLDPMADKVLIGTLFLSLTYVDLIPVALTSLIIGRDVILIISGFVIRYQSLPPPRTLSRYFDVTHATAQLAPTFISKVNTGIQLVLVATTLAAPVFGYVNHPYLQTLWYVTACSTITAAGSYVFSKETYKYLKRQRKDR